MKTVDVSENVMNSVVRLEKRRTRAWYLRFFILLAVLLAAVGVCAVIGYRIVSDRQGWDLLTLFGEDPEIIGSYWQDTLWIFWEQAPQKIIFTLLAILCFCVIIVVITRRKRRLLRKKLRQLEKYS